MELTKYTENINSYNICVIITNKSKYFNDSIGLINPGPKPPKILYYQLLNMKQTMNKELNIPFDISDYTKLLYRIMLI